jgi:hypothetical protein
MNFNVDRIAQLAGLSSAGDGASRSLNESASRPPRAASTYDRVVEELQTRGLEMFYSPEQINEAIRTESRLLREEREMEMEMHGGKHSHGSMYETEDMDAEELLERESDEMEGMYADEGMAVGTIIKDPDGTEMRVTKGSSGTLAEAKLRNLISAEVDRVLAEMDEKGDTAWMYQDGKRPSVKSKGATMGFVGIGFKR